MPTDSGMGKLLLQLMQQVQERFALLWRARITEVTFVVSSSHIANANAVFVPNLAVCALHKQRTSMLYRAVSMYQIVIPYHSKTSLFVPTIYLFGTHFAPFRRVSAMNNNVINGSHSSICFVPRKILHSLQAARPCRLARLRKRTSSSASFFILLSRRNKRNRRNVSAAPMDPPVLITPLAIRRGAGGEAFSFFILHSSFFILHLEPSALLLNFSVLQYLRLISSKAMYPRCCHTRRALSPSPFLPCC